MLKENQLIELSCGIYRVIAVNENRARVRLVKEKIRDSEYELKAMQEFDISPNSEVKIVKEGI